MLEILRFLKNKKGLGLVEALVALAVVGTAMVIITTISIKTIKKARKNELQDVAVQAKVEALDYLKDPTEIQAKFGSSCDLTSLSGYARLDFSETTPILVGTGGTSSGEVEIDAKSKPDSKYLNPSLSPDYEVYQQVYIESDSGRADRFNIRSIVVWQSVGGEYERSTESGYRMGSINLIGGDAEGNCPK